ncbi:MAG: copper transporter [Trebonia sp.]
MIDFRYHLVSIVAVFLALAIGIVLGATQLQRTTVDVLQSTSNNLSSKLNAVSAERDTYQTQSNASEQFLQTAQRTLLAGRLTGQRVVLITEPGAQASVISGVQQAVGDAHATVTGEIALQPRFNDIDGATQSSLAAIDGTIGNSDGTVFDQGTNAQTTYQQEAAQLIATAVLTKSSSSSGSQGGARPGISAASAQTMLSAFATQGYLTVSGDVTGGSAGRATLAVLVVPQAAPAAGQDDPVNQVLLAITPEFAAAGSSTVAVGSTTGAAQPGNSISVLRGSSVSDKVSTVDNGDMILGQITVAEALAALLAGGKPNSYGISGASAVSPDPLPSAIPTATASAPRTTDKKTSSKSDKKTVEKK